MPEVLHETMALRVKSKDDAIVPLEGVLLHGVSKEPDCCFFALVDIFMQKICWDRGLLMCRMLIGLLQQLQDSLNWAICGTLYFPLVLYLRRCITMLETWGNIGNNIGTMATCAMRSPATTFTEDDFEDESFMQRPTHPQRPTWSLSWVERLGLSTTIISQEASAEHRHCVHYQRSFIPTPYEGGTYKNVSYIFGGGVGPKKCNHYILEVFLKM